MLVEKQRDKKISFILQKDGYITHYSKKAGDLIKNFSRKNVKPFIQELMPSLNEQDTQELQNIILSSG